MLHSKLPLPDSSAEKVELVEKEIKSADALRTSLKEFRLNRSRELGVKPYHIFTNRTLESIIESPPATKEELLLIEGIGKKKLEEFGNEILAIIKD